MFPQNEPVLLTIIRYPHVYVGYIMRGYIVDTLQPEVLTFCPFLGGPRSLDKVEHT